MSGIIHSLFTMSCERLEPYTSALSRQMDQRPKLFVPSDLLHRRTYRGAVPSKYRWANAHAPEPTSAPILRPSKSSCAMWMPM